MTELEALIAALGIRPVRMFDLGVPSLLLGSRGIMLIDAQLSEEDRGRVIDHALQYVTEQEVAK